jgi:COP9 signalosome complex subunit 3
MNTVTLLARGIVQLAESHNNVRRHPVASTSYYFLNIIGKLKAAVAPLYDLTTRYPPSLSYLTTLHPYFVHVRCFPDSHLLHSSLPLFISHA